MISVLIITRNQSKKLRQCLFSVQKQTFKPNEVVVVNNNSSDNTVDVCNFFKKTLPIKSELEKLIGIPFARNRSIRLAKNKIVAFIDDDCIANPEWLKQILTHFHQYPQAVGVIGKTINANPTNIASSIEYSYYLRWLSDHIMNIRDTGKLSSGLCIDFKNAAFRSSFIKQFKFSTTAPYGDVGDEDVEVGYRLFKANQNIYYNPSIRVSHQYSTSLKRLFVRNFWNGYANQTLSQTHDLDVSKNNKSYAKKSTLQDATQINGLFRQWTYKGVKIIFPIFSGLGRLYAKTKTTKRSIPLRI